MLETLRETLSRDPFSPFVIVLSSGDRFTIETPALVALGKGQLAYYPPRSSGVIHMRLNQITFLQVDELWT